VLAALVTRAAGDPLSALPSLQLPDASQITTSYVVEHTKEVAAIGMAVLAAGVLVIGVLALCGNVGLHGTDDAYAPAGATVAVQVTKRAVSLGWTAVLRPPAWCGRLGPDSSHATHLPSCPAEPAQQPVHRRMMPRACQAYARRQRGECQEQEHARAGSTVVGRCQRRH
jgi:hypothetical protein